MNFSGEEFYVKTVEETVSSFLRQTSCASHQACFTKSPYLDYTGAAEYTTLHPVTLWRAVKAGRLKASGYGRAVRFHLRDLDEFMASRNRK